MAIKTIPERRRVPRIDFQGRVEVDQFQARSHLQASSVNFSESGLCFRLQQALDVRSRVKLRLFAVMGKRPVECAARVAWVVQRLDLRDAPPFVYDVGVEFIDPPPRVRTLAAKAGVTGKPLGMPMVAERGPVLQSVTVNDRCYMPHLNRESSTANRWHLVVTIDDVPCFSQRFASTRDAVSSWERFKRQAALPNPRSKGR